MWNCRLDHTFSLCICIYSFFSFFNSSFSYFTCFVCTLRKIIFVYIIINVFVWWQHEIFIVCLISEFSYIYSIVGIYYDEWWHSTMKSFETMQYFWILNGLVMHIETMFYYYRNTYGQFQWNALKTVDEFLIFLVPLNGRSKQGEYTRCIFIHNVKQAIKLIRYQSIHI